MSLRKIKFGDTEVYKTKFYSSKQAISLDSIDLNKIVVSKKWKIKDATYKYICGYLNNDTIQPLCVVLPQYILIMAEKICHLLRMMRKFMKSIMKYGK